MVAFSSSIRRLYIPTLSKLCESENVIMLLTHVCFTLKISPFNVCVNFTKVGICDLIKLANKPNNNMSIKFR
jgi:hypothetical protein